MPEILPQAEKLTADFTVGVQQSAPIKAETSAQTAARLQDEPSAAKKSASPEKIAQAQTVSISVAKISVAARRKKTLCLKRISDMSLKMKAVMPMKRKSTRKPIWGLSKKR